MFKKFNTAKTDKGIEFTAEYGKKYRFFENPAASYVSLHGNWDIALGEIANKIVGVFSQFGNKLTGTFLTTTGDYVIMRVQCKVMIFICQLSVGLAHH